MLKKGKDIIDITKRRAILLFEVDFNTLNKIIFNSKVILAIEKKQSIHCKIIRDRRDHSAIHIALKKTNLGCY